MNNILSKSIVVMLLVVLAFALSGCFGGKQAEETPEGMIQISKTSYLIQKNAVNNMVSNALKFTVTDMQRRPMSTFAGSAISRTDSLTSSSDSKVSAAATNDIAVQIDISFTWNVNSYVEAVAAAGGKANRVPSTLSDLLAPGQLMYIQGEDQDGNKYQSADIITPESQKYVNQLAINAQWDYNALYSDLPETSVVKTGSILFRVPSTVKNLKLIIITPTGGQEITSPKNVPMGNVAVYELPLT